MTKVLEATCTAGVVLVGTLPVPTAEILSAGVGESSGVLLLDEDRAAYIADTTPDLETTLAKLSSSLGDISSALTTIANTLTAIGAGMTGPTTAPPPTLATDVAQITAGATSLTAIQTQVDLLKETLK